MNMSRFFTLFKREIQDILRDKKTLVMMIVIPMLLYPTIILGMAFVMSSMASSEEEKTYYVAFDESATKYEKPISEIIKKEKEEIGYTLEILRAEDCEKSLQEKTIDAYLSVNEEGVIEICYLSAKTKSQTAESALKSALGIYKDNLREQNINDLGLDVEYILNPITYELSDLSTTEESVGNIMGQVLPFMIITSILLGAMYPAIDVTAGEKERGTLETLLTLPIKNVEMIGSKFLAVSVLAVFSAFLNILSMVGAIAILVCSSLAATANIDMKINVASFVPGILFSMLVMAFFALLVTALCMCACVFAKSFKEANNYLTPIMLVIMFLSYAPMLPDVELTAQTALIPVVNVALMIEALFGFQYDYQLFAMVLFTNIAYSFLTIWVLSKIYNSEAILFSEGFTSVKIFEKRSDMKEKQMPQLGDLVLLLSVTLLLMFYGGSLISASFPQTALYITQIIIICSTVFYIWYMKADYKKLLSLKRPKIKHLLGAICLWASSFVAALIVGGLIAPFFKESASNIMELEEYMKSVPPVMLFICLAILPPICEELFFRGFIMGTLKNKFRPWIAILVTAFIFAAYHMSLIKMFTVGIIGLGFTFYAYYADSIFVSMLMHFLNNSFAYLIMIKPELVKKVFPALMEEAMKPYEYILIPVVLIVGFLLGLYLLFDTKLLKRNKKEKQ